MAHYVFQRNNGYGDFDYIRSFETMEITDYPELAAQVDDKYVQYIDMYFLNSQGFYAVGITALGLRIAPHLQFMPMARGYRPVAVPRPPRPHVPGATRAPGPVPRPPRAAAPRAPKAPSPVPPRPAAPRAPKAPGPVVPRPPKPAAPRTPKAPPRTPLGMIVDTLLDPRKPGGRGPGR